MSDVAEKEREIQNKLRRLEEGDTDNPLNFLKKHSFRDKENVER